MEPSESSLRQFLYIDIPLLTDLLSQMEGGSYESETRTTEETRSRVLRVRLASALLLGPSR